MENFKVEKLSERFFRIIEFSGVCCYLAVGEKRACLIDTCCGYGNIKEYVKNITDKEVFVVLTHGHHDHMGAAALFGEVYMNYDDMDVYNEFGNMDFRVKDIKDHKETAHIDINDLVPTKFTGIKDINDGDTFDLGGLTIKMIVVKGHTPGIICPLIIEERKIIFGDACGVGVLLFDKYSSNVSEYRESLLKLKKYENQYDNIYRNHGTFFSEKDLLDNVIECCQLILDKNDDHMPISTHGFDLFSAKKIQNHNRVDGKFGNILYSIEKAK